ncbi:MAG: sigma-54-dependent transcriptional regulator [Syntrophobacteraceae bacterium]
MISDKHLLVVEDDKLVRFSLKVLLESQGYHVDIASNGDQAWDLIRSNKYSLVLCDINLPGRDGKEILEQIKANGIESKLLLFTGYGNVTDAVDCIKNGAYDYFVKPIDDDRLIATIKRALEQKSLSRKRHGRPPKASPGANVVFKSKAMQNLFKQATVAAQSEATILISGQSGTGKTLLAKFIHSNSVRRNDPFVEVSCGALSEGLLESELFGHKKGSFTGAIRDNIGKFEAAGAGTLFLDDVNSASLSLQVKLLRIIEERVYERVGDHKTFHTDARIVAATNQDLLEYSRQGLFREDLYHRLNVISLEIPSLNERKEDIPILAEHFVRRASAKHNRVVKRIHPNAMEVLIQHPWSGNVRELENIIERAVIFSEGSELKIGSFPKHMSLIETPDDRRSNEDLELSMAMERWERAHILSVLAINKGNRTKTADCLKISRATLFNKMRKYDLL